MKKIKGKWKIYKKGKWCGDYIKEFLDEKFENNEKREWMKEKINQIRYTTCGIDEYRILLLCEKIMKSEEWEKFLEEICFFVENAYEDGYHSGENNAAYWKEFDRLGYAPDLEKP